MSVHKTARLCEHCEQPMTDPKILRRRHPVTNGRVCLDCLDINVPEWGPRLAHDGGTSVPNHCFGGETVYLTKSGRRTLAETVGTVQEVLTSSDPSDPKSGRWVSAEIHDFGQQQLWEVTLRRNKMTKVIRATAGHRWLVTSGPNRNQHRIVVTEDLRANHRLAHLRPVPVKVAFDNDSVRRGFVFGDGSITHDRGGAGTSRASVNLWGAKMALSDIFEEVTRPGRQTVTTNGIEGVSYSSGMAGYTKALPDLDEAPEYLYGWLAGYFAADGSLYAPDKTMSISSSSQSDLEHVRDLCTSLGIGTYQITSKWRTGYRDEPTLIHQLAFCQSDLTADFFVRPDQRDNFEKSTHHHERMGWTVVSSTPTESTETVYCAVVPETETFVLEDNIWTGNCPFCGSGAVISGADGTIECGYCDSNFIVKVQPKHNGTPQTQIEGDEGEWTPGMGDPAMAGDPLADPLADSLAKEEDPFAEESEEEPGAVPEQFLNSAALRLLSAEASGSAFCMRCHTEDLPLGMLCRRGDHPFVDHGPDGDPDLARYEGVCLRCCGHNHG